MLERRFEQCPGNRKRLLPSTVLNIAGSFWARWRARRTEVLIEGSSGSSGGLVGEHQPDELMRDGGRPADGGDERDEGLAGGRAHARLGMARGQRQNNIAVQAEQGAVARRQD